MKNIVLIIALCGFSFCGFSQVQVNAQVSCPPCRPITGCGVCWETQAQAAECQSLKTPDNKKGEENVVLVTNPVLNGSFEVQSNSVLSGKILILSQMGKVVKTINLQKNKSNYINIHVNAEAGLYFMIYYDSNGKKTATKKLIFTN